MENRLPKNWVECKLGDVVKIQNGYAFPSKDFRRVGNIPLIKQSQLDGNKVSLTDCVYLDASYLETKKDFILYKGDILIGMSGSIGKLCLYDLDVPSLQNQRTGKIVPRSKDFSRRFLWYYLSTIEGQLKDKGKGLGVANVSARDIEDLPFNLPPEAEQNRIVAKLDELMEKIDRSRARLERIPEILKRFRQSVLAAAISGQLTKEWRRFNKGKLSGQLQESIEDFNSKRKYPLKYRKGAGSISELNVPMIPKEWIWTETCKLAKDAPNSICAGPFGTIFKAKDFRDRGIPIIFLRHVIPGKFEWKSSKFMDEKVWKTHHVPYSVYGGELLVTKLGDPPGAAAIYPEKEGVAMVTPDVIKMDAENKLVFTEYLMNFFNSSVAKKIFTELSFGVTRLRIDLNMFKRIPIPLPESLEQLEILRRIDQLFEVADRMEERCTKARAQLNELPQSLLAKAFRGELVAQNLKDEPASALLERIILEKKRPIAAHTRKGKSYKLNSDLSLAAEP